MAIFPDMLKSSEPIAHVIDDTNKGTIKHLSILFGKKERKNEKKKLKISCKNYFKKIELLLWHTLRTNHLDTEYT